MKKGILMLCSSLLFTGTLFGQGYEFKPLKFTTIDGAPKLSNPQFVLTDKKTPVHVVKLGMAAPAIYDWNHDEKNDLLVGEFGSSGRTNVVIFENIGTNKEPIYSADTTYATDKNGRLMSVEGSWCLGFYPQVVDINGDGIMDIATGIYTGKMYYYPGNGTGFEMRKELKQVTDVRARDAFTKVMYTNPTFADFNGDGLLDAFVGGSGGIRVMLNQGTKEEPFFGERTTIYDVNGAPVVPWERTEEQMQNCKKENKNPAGMDFKLFTKLIDWDNDGTPDLITSSGYIYENSYTFGFHKGVKDVNGQLKFRKAVPLVVAEDGGKALPGSVFMLNVVDVNDDGVLDILFGASIVANAETKQIDAATANIFDIYKKNVVDDASMKTIGYVLVMYGSK